MASASLPADDPDKRRELLEYLLAAFHDELCEADCEDAVQRAYLELYEAQSHGEEIRDRWSWLRTTAWRRADDAWRHHEIRACDGDDDVLAEAPSGEQPAEERLDTEASLARAREALQQLSAEERDAFRARYTNKLRTKEACGLLDINRSTYFERCRRAIEHITAAVVGVSERFDEAVIALINAYLAGSTDAAEKQRLERLIAKEPRYAAVFRELRGVNEKLGASLPPLAAEPEVHRGIVERLAGAEAKVRETIAGAFHRGGNESAETAASQMATSGGTRGAGGAAIASGGAAAGLLGGKAVTVCVGGAALCLAGGAAVVAPWAGLGDKEPPPNERPAVSADQARPSAPASELLPSQVGNEAPEPNPEPSPNPAPTAPAPAPAQAAAPEPVAPAPTPQEQEFNDLAPAPSTATAPSSGGGGDSLSGGGGGAAEQEFGSP